MKLRLTMLLALAPLGHFAMIEAQSRGPEHWVATWTTAQLLVRTPPARAARARQDFERLRQRPSGGGDGPYRHPE